MREFIQYILQQWTSAERLRRSLLVARSIFYGAVLVAFAGKTNALGFLHWFPLFIELSYLAPLL